MPFLVRAGEGEREGIETSLQDDGPGVSSVDCSVGAIEGSRGTWGALPLQVLCAMIEELK